MHSTRITLIVLVIASLLASDALLDGQEDGDFEPNSDAGHCPGFALITYVSPKTQEEYFKQREEDKSVSAYWPSMYDITAWIEKPEGINLVKVQNIIRVDHDARDLDVEIKKWIGRSSLAVIDIIENHLVVLKKFDIDSAARDKIIARERAGLSDVTRLRRAKGYHDKIFLFDAIAAETVTPSLYLIADTEYWYEKPLPGQDLVLWLKGLLAIYRNPHTANDIRSELYHLMERCRSDTTTNHAWCNDQIVDALLPHFSEINKENGMTMLQGRYLIDALQDIVPELVGNKMERNRVEKIKSGLDMLSATLPNISQQDGIFHDRIITTLQMIDGRKQ